MINCGIEQIYYIYYHYGAFYTEKLCLPVYFLVTPKANKSVYIQYVYGQTYMLLG